MDAPIPHFEQRNGLTRVELRLGPDYVEYSISGRNKTGFNTKYETLFNDFYYKTFRVNDHYVRSSLIVIAVLLPFELLMRQHISALVVVGIAIVFGVIFSGVGYVLRRLIRREYTAIPTGSGNLLIVKDTKHDTIVRELQARRAGALAKLAVVNPLTPPWQEVKKFKFLRDEGIISAEDFPRYREMILAYANASGEPAVANETAVRPRTLH